MTIFDFVDGEAKEDEPATAALDDAPGSLEAIVRDRLLQMLGALKDVSSRVRSGFLVDEILQYIYQSMKPLLPFERLGLALLEDEGTALRSLWVRSELADVKVPVGYKAELAGSSLQRILDSGRPRIVNDLEAYLADHPHSASTRLIVQEGIRSSLTCPLIAGGRPLGFIFFSSVELGAYQSAHVDTFTAVAEQIAGILETGAVYQKQFVVMRAYEEALSEGMPDALTDEYHRLQDQSIKELGELLVGMTQRYEETYSESRLMAEVTRRINIGLSLDAVLDYIYESFGELLPYHRMGFSMLEQDGAWVRSHWGRSDAEAIRVPVGYAAPLKDTSLEKVLERGQPRIIDDLHAYLEEKPDSHATRLIVEEGYHSSLTCPLYATGRELGFLFFSCMEPGSYSEVHIDRIRRIAEPLGVILEKGRLFHELAIEREKSERLLCNVLPSRIADRLKEKDDHEVIADRVDNVSVMFADIVGFTRHSAAKDPGEVVGFLNQFFTACDQLADEMGVTKLSTIGDAYMAATGLSSDQPDHAQLAVWFAMRVADIAGQQATPDGRPLRLRIGIHTGPVVAGVIGKKTFQYDVWGDTVNLAARLESTCPTGRIHISADTRQFLNGDFPLESRGATELKGYPSRETWLV